MGAELAAADGRRPSARREASVRLTESSSGGWAVSSFTLATDRCDEAGEFHGKLGFQIRDPAGVPITFLQWIETGGESS